MQTAGEELNAAEIHAPHVFAPAEFE